MNEKRLFTIKQFWIITGLLLVVHGLSYWLYGVGISNLEYGSPAIYLFWLFSVAFLYSQQHYVYHQLDRFRSPQQHYFPGRGTDAYTVIHQHGACVVSFFLILFVATKEAIQLPSIFAIPLFFSLSYLYGHYRRKKHSAEPTPEIDNKETFTGSPLLFRFLIGICIVFAVLIVVWKNQQEEAVTALEKLGATAIRRDDDGNVVQVYLNNTEITDADFEHLQSLPKLQRLRLQHPAITDAGLEHLQGLRDLEELPLGQTQITDVGLEHLKGLTALKVLHLHGTKITDAGLVHLKGLTELDYLNLSETQISDAGLVHLKDLTNLESLHLWDTKITDAGIVHLKGLTKLEKLTLANTQISDAGLVYLKGMTELDYLNLSGTQISDAGLEHLQGLLKLTSLSLSNTDVTNAGVAKLKRVLYDALSAAQVRERGGHPYCNITH